MSGLWPTGLVDPEAMETMLALGSEAQVTVGLETELNVSVREEKPC